jgi:sugar phosphate permease
MVGTPIKSPTQFIPMMLGIPVLFCGVVALNPHRRRHAMHVASAIGLLGAIAGAARAMYCLLELASGNEIDRYGFKIIGAMSVICTIFVMICVVSFIQARRRKAAGVPDKSVSSINLADTVVEDDRVTDVKPRESA